MYAFFFPNGLPSRPPCTDVLFLGFFRHLSPLLGGAPSTAKHFLSEIRNKSGNTLETLSEQILNRTVGDPQTVENKADSLPRLISELCYPQYGWDPFLFWKGPLWEGKEGLTCHFRVSLVLQYFGVPRYPDAGKNSTESVIVTPLFVCLKC